MANRKGKMADAQARAGLSPMVWDQRKHQFGGLWKRTPERVAYFLKALEKLGTLNGGATAAGISRTGAMRWAEDPELRPKIIAALEAYEKNLGRALGESQAARLAGEDKILTVAERKARHKAEVARQVATLPLSQQRRWEWDLIDGMLFPVKEREVPQTWEEGKRRRGM